MLLLIRSADDVGSAVEAASEFLVYQRGRFAPAYEEDEVLGVWLRRELEADLPGIRESFSRSGMWTLCWINHALLSTALSATERRRITLDSLLAVASASRGRSSSAAKTFFPVFAAADADDAIKASMSELQDRHPQTIGETWFLDDGERGIVPARS